MRIDEYISLMHRSIEFDPWVKERGLLGYAEELILESKELQEGIRNDDACNIKEELGDVFHDWLHTCLLAGKKHGFTIQDVIDASETKFRRRKPYLFEQRKVTLEEAKAIWKKAKEEESG
jgi:NTP pyrophosphatase (non-canonical NTP hydrolase)